MQRRRHLVIELGRKKEFISKAELTDLSPSIARYYADKTDKTLTRDLNWLAQKKLIVRKGKAWMANIGIMRAFCDLEPERIISLLFSDTASGRGNLHA